MRRPVVAACGKAQMAVSECIADPRSQGERPITGRLSGVAGLWPAQTVPPDIESG